MENYSDFKKYFDGNFWRCFKEITLDFEEISKEKRNEILETTYERISQGTYSPSVPKRYLYENKGCGVTRTIPVFEIEDYCVYYYCVKKLESLIAFNRIENTFGGWSLGGQLRAQEDFEIQKRKESHDEYENMMAERYDISISEYSFNPKAWRKAYGEYNEKLKATYVESSHYPYVVEFDISNFYDCIRLDLLENWIREIAHQDDYEIINLLFYFLNHWNRKVNIYNKQTVGIPQDALADCSRILANFYLQKYDQYVYHLCNIYDCRYLRFSDDQMIFGSELKKLEFLIFLITKKIVNFGLNINQKKVVYRKVEDMMEYRGFEFFDMINESMGDEIVIANALEKYFQIGDEKRKNMKTGGAHFLRKIIFANLNGLNAELRGKLEESLLYSDFLEKCSIEQMKRVYEILGSKRDDLIEILRERVELTFHNIFHLKVLFFFKELGIEHQDIIIRIGEIEDLELENGYSYNLSLEEAWLF